MEVVTIITTPTKFQFNVFSMNNQFLFMGSDNAYKIKQNKGETIFNYNIIALKCIRIVIYIFTNDPEYMVMKFEIKTFAALCLSVLQYF